MGCGNNGSNSKDNEEAPRSINTPNEQKNTADSLALKDKSGSEQTGTSKNDVKKEEKAKEKPAMIKKAADILTSKEMLRKLQKVKGVAEGKFAKYIGLMPESYKRGEFISSLKFEKHVGVTILKAIVHMATTETAAQIAGEFYLKVPEVKRYASYVIIVSPEDKVLGITEAEWKIPVSAIVENLQYGKSGAPYFDYNAILASTEMYQDGIKTHWIK